MNTENNETQDIIKGCPTENLESLCYITLLQCTVTWREAAKVYIAGGWMRVASIDMIVYTCPSGLRTLTRLCADSPGCSSAVLPVQGVQIPG